MKLRMNVIDVVAGVRHENGRYWIVQRDSSGEHGHLAGLWEFPGGKVEEGESTTSALHREMEEEFGVEIKVGFHYDSIPAVMDVWDDTIYHVHFFSMRFLNEPKFYVHQNANWATLEELLKYPHLPSGIRFVSNLYQELS